MHIPDNFLSPSTCVVLGASMLPVWRNASRKIKKEFTKKRIPMLGICAAFSFLIMMFNLPLPGGTTGHAVGAVLAAILLGPHAAAIAITITLVVQAVFFGDGGILALGANTFNMAFIMPYSGYYLYTFLKGKVKSNRGEYAVVFAAGYAGVVLAALATAIEFGLQPLLFKDSAGLPLYCPYPLKVSIPAMLVPHLLVVGIVEGLVTAGVYAYIRKVSPEAIHKTEAASVKPIYILLAVLAALTPVGLLARGTAWGEWANEELKTLVGYVPAGMEKGFGFKAAMPDYTLAGTPEIISYILSAAAGMTIIFIIIKLTGRFSKDKMKG